MELPLRREGLLGDAERVQEPGASFAAASTDSASFAPQRSRPQIIYALVARGRDQVLAEHSGVDADTGRQLTGNFRTFTVQLLLRIEESVDWKSYVYGDHAFHYIVDKCNQLWFLCMADTAMGRRVPFAFLGEIQASTDHSSAALESLMCKWNSADADRLTRLNERVRDLNQSLMENLALILERQEKIELMVAKTQDLRTDATSFRTAARELHREVWWRNARTLSYMGVASLMIVLFILFSTCGIALGKCM